MATIVTNKPKLSEVILEILQENGEISQQAMVEAIQEKVPGTSLTLIKGALIRMKTAEQIVINEKQNIIINENAPVRTKSTQQTSAQVIDLDEAFKEYEETGIHPMLGRELTEEEKVLLIINEQKVNGITLEPNQTILRDQMLKGTLITSLFFGDPGNGKTTVAREIARQLNMPVYSQNYGANAEELDIIGGFVPDEDRPGSFKWVDGQFTQAFRNGGIYIAEEPNYAKPGVLGVLNNALDGVGELLLRTGEVIQRHPAFRFFGCMNVGVVGTQKMNPALKNRMNKVVKFEAMPEEKQIKVIMKESGLNDRALAKKMVQTGDAIRKKLKDESVDNATISIRNLVNWAKDIVDTHDVLESSKSTVIWAVCVEDEEVQEEIFKDIIEPRFRGYKI